VPGPPFIKIATPSASATSCSLAPCRAAGVRRDAAVAFPGDRDSQRDQLLHLGGQLIAFAHRGGRHLDVAGVDAGDLLAQLAAGARQVIE
jgi:hypothetical protein